MTFESFKSSKIRLKHRRKREKEFQRKRKEGEKGFGSDDPVYAGETIKRLEL